MPEPAVSIVVITRNRAAILRECVACLDRLDLPADMPAEVLVVDSSTGGETWEFLKTRSDIRRFRIVDGRDNMPAARNMGIENARGAFIAFLDDDCMAEPGWIRALVLHFEDPAVGAVGGRLVDERVKRVEDPGGPVGVVARNGAVVANFTRHTGSALDVDHLPGGNMSFRSGVLRSLGGFDAVYTGPNYNEETDMCVRVKHAGHRVVFEPAAAVRHLNAPREATDRQGFDRRLVFFSARNMTVFLLKNYRLTWRRFIHHFLGTLKAQVYIALKDPGEPSTRAIWDKTAGMACGIGVALKRRFPAHGFVRRNARKLAQGGSFLRWAATSSAATPARFMNAAVVYVLFKTFRPERVPGYPVDITIEPTNVCNLRCPLCPSSRAIEGVPKGKMTLADFTRILDRLGRWLYGIELHNWGEPLLHPDLVAMVEHAVRKKIEVRLSTNLNHLSPDLANGLVTSGVAAVFVSVDGVTQDVYAGYRVRGNFEKVLENIRLLQSIKKELKSGTPRLIWNYVRTASNAHQVEDARELARSLGMEFRLNEAMINFGLLEPFDTALERNRGWLPDENAWFDHRARVQRERQGAGACDWPWMRLSVNWDGGVWPCCYVYHPERAFGNMLTGDFHLIWNGPAYRAARRIVANRDKGPGHICEFCRREAG